MSTRHGYRSDRPANLGSDLVTGPSPGENLRVKREFFLHELIEGFEVVLAPRLSVIRNAAETQMSDENDVNLSGCVFWCRQPPDATGRKVSRVWCVCVGNQIAGRKSGGMCSKRFAKTRQSRVCADSVLNDSLFVEVRWRTLDGTVVMAL